MWQRKAVVMSVCLFVCCFLFFLFFFSLFWLTFGNLQEFRADSYQFKLQFAKTERKKKLNYRPAQK